MRPSKSPILLVSCAEDTASMNIREALLAAQKWEETGRLWDNPVMVSENGVYLSLLPDEHLYHNHLDKDAHRIGLDPKIVVFLSRHRSKAGTKSLTIHPIGNYRSNDFGGLPQKLVPSAPREMANILISLREHAKGLEHAVTYEVTHHGPYLETPTMFVEIGSQEDQWENEEAGKAIANTIAETDLAKPGDDTILVGIGGGHYAPRFSDIVFKRKACFGHMVPSYALENAGEEEAQSILKKAFDATPEAQGFYIHKKGLKSREKKLVAAALESMDAAVLKTKDLENRDG